MRMGQGVRTGLGHGGITCVLQTQFSSFFFFFFALKLLSLCHYFLLQFSMNSFYTCLGHNESVHVVF